MAKTDIGLVPGTLQKSTSGGFAVANNATLESHNTFVYVYYRCGSNGRVATLRRKHYLADALCNIGSEGEDVFIFKQSYWFDERGREMFDAPRADGTRQSVKLHMSPNNLGWYWIEPIKDPSVVRQLLVDNKIFVQSVVAPIISLKAPAWFKWPCVPDVVAPLVSDVSQGMLVPLNPHTGVSMNRPAKLTGYEILVRMHVVLGHCGLATLLTTLASLPGTKGMI